MSDKGWFAGLSAGDPLEIVSLRDPSVGDSTASYIQVNGQHFCHGIEDPVREPKEGRPSGDWAALEAWVRSWKVDKKTAIPMGRYSVGIDRSARFKKLMIAIRLVPGYTGVRAHGGLSPEHSEGCVILGDELHKIDAGWRVRDGQSKPAVDRLFGVIAESLDAGLEVWWTFKPNQNAA